jgi:hypothetical protein
MDTFVLSANFSIHTFVGHAYQSGGGGQFCIDDYKSIENEYKKVLRLNTKVLVSNTKVMS